MVLADALISIPQTERGGEIAQRGFDYQSCWALSEMLKYELEEKDYVFVFEYHDDVIIFDREDNPQDLTFVQVKTREKHWTPNSLYKATKSDPTSIIAKQFLLQKAFLSYANKAPNLMFVTNASINFPNFGATASFSADCLLSDDQDKLKKAVAEQTQMNRVDIDLSTLKFVQTSLSLLDHITHLKGILSNFLTKKYVAGTSLHIDPLANLLITECGEKAKFKSSDVAGITDLVSKKGFSSKAFNSIIDSLNIDAKVRPSWDNAKSIFSSLNKDAISLIILEGVFSRITIDLNQNKKNPSTVYLDAANALFDKNKLDNDLELYIAETIKSIDADLPSYALALEDSRKKECIVVYSIIQKLLKGEQ